MEEHHYKLYKPFGFLSQFKNNQTTRRNKKLLGELFPFPPGVMAIGRLDEDSEGLLLLTTSGKLSELIRSKKVEKEYYVQLDGLIDSGALTQLEQGVEIGINGKKYLTRACKVFQLPKTPDLPPRSKKIRDERHGPTSWISVTLTEGKFRQVKKMTAAVGFPTLRLVRVRIAGECIDNLAPGESLKVTNFRM